MIKHYSFGFARVIAIAVTEHVTATFDGEYLVFIQMIDDKVYIRMQIIAP